MTHQHPLHRRSGQTYICSTSIITIGSRQPLAVAATGTWKSSLHACARWACARASIRRDSAKPRTCEPRWSLFSGKISCLCVGCHDLGALDVGWQMAATQQVPTLGSAASNAPACVWVGGRGVGVGVSVAALAWRRRGIDSVCNWTHSAVFGSLHTHIHVEPHIHTLLPFTVHLSWRPVVLSPLPALHRCTVHCGCTETVCSDLPSSACLPALMHSCQSFKANADDGGHDTWQVMEVRLDIRFGYMHLPATKRHAASAAPHAGLAWYQPGLARPLAFSRTSFHDESIAKP